MIYTEIYETARKACWFIINIYFSGLSALGAGLFGLGIPTDSVLKYETALKADEYLVIAHGSSEEVDKAKEIITPLNISDVTIHNA